MEYLAVFIAGIALAPAVAFVRKPMPRLSARNHDDGMAFGVQLLELAFAGTLAVLQHPLRIYVTAFFDMRVTPDEDRYTYRDN